jgi:hypothetical protein
MEEKREALVPAKVAHVALCKCRPKEYDKEQEQYYRCEHDQLWHYYRQYTTWRWERIGMTNSGYHALMASYKLAQLDGTGRVAPVVSFVSLPLIPTGLIGSIACAIQMQPDPTTWSWLSLSFVGVTGWLLSRQAQFRKRYKNTLRWRYESKLTSERRRTKAHADQLVELQRKVQTDLRSVGDIRLFVEMERQRLKDIWNSDADTTSAKREVLDQIESLLPLEAKLVNQNDPPDFQPIFARSLEMGTRKYICPICRTRSCNDPPALSRHKAKGHKKKIYFTPKNCKK